MCMSNTAVICSGQALRYKFQRSHSNRVLTSCSQCFNRSFWCCYVWMRLLSRHWDIRIVFGLFSRPGSELSYVAFGSFEAKLAPTAWGSDRRWPDGRSKLLYLQNGGRETLQQSISYLRVSVFQFPPSACGQLVATRPPGAVSAREQRRDGPRPRVGGVWVGAPLVAGRAVRRQQTTRDIAGIVRGARLADRKR